MVGDLPPCIVLAAGKGTRAGGPKAMVLVDGRPWIAHQIDALAQVGVSYAVVVATNATRDMSFVRSSAMKVEIAVNDAPERGPFSSVQIGAARVLADASAIGAFVLPVDVPCAGREVWSALSAKLVNEPAHAHAPLALVPMYNGRGGHPLLCARAWLESLLLVHAKHENKDNESARLDVQLNQLPPASVVRLPVADPRVCANWNRAEDFLRAP